MKWNWHLTGGDTDQGLIDLGHNLQMAIPYFNHDASTQMW